MGWNRNDKEGKEMETNKGKTVILLLAVLVLSTVLFPNTVLGSGMRLDYSANFTLKKGSTYTITYWVKTSAPASMMVALEPGWVFNARVITSVSGTDFTDGVYLFDNSPGGSWQKITNTFTVSDVMDKTSGRSCRADRTGRTSPAQRTSPTLRYPVDVFKPVLPAEGQSNAGQPGWKYGGLRGI